jgi:ribulose-bisphosphate carboxylase large chain
MGTDILFLAGGGILGHPDGPTAGARAMMKAVEAAIKNIPIEEAVKESQELKKAIEKWGYIERW